MSIALEIIQLILNVVLVGATIISLLIAIKSFSKSEKDSKIDFKKNATIRAVELSQEYASLLDDITFVNNVLNMSGISKQMNKMLNEHKINNFDFEELERIAQCLDYNDAQSLVTDFDNRCIDDNILFECYMNKYDYTPKELAFYTIHQKRLNKIELCEEEKRIKLSAEYDCWYIKIKQSFFDKAHFVLNRLESMAMAIVTGVADSNVVYPSLHQTYNKLIISLYFIISGHNKQTHNKYYMYCIKLFNEWIKRQEEEIEQNQKRNNKELSKNVYVK